MSEKSHFVNRNFIQLLTFIEVNIISYHMVARVDTEKYLTRGNLYHPRHTCITRDIVKGNTGVSRVIQVLQGSDYFSVLPWQPCDYDFITPKKSWTLTKFYGNSNEN